MRNYSVSTLFFIAALVLPFASTAHKDEKHKDLPKTVQAMPPQDNGIQIEVKDGWVTNGPEVIKVSQGDQVTVTFTSDHADELHLHGYDITVPLKANTPATLSFIAKYPGRFGYELHHVHREIGAIEVHP